MKITRHIYSGVSQFPHVFELTPKELKQAAVEYEKTNVKVGDWVLSKSSENVIFYSKVYSIDSDGECRDVLNNLLGYPFGVSNNGIKMDRVAKKISNEELEFLKKHHPESFKED